MRTDRVNESPVCCGHYRRRRSSSSSSCGKTTRSLANTAIHTRGGRGFIALWLWGGHPDNVAALQSVSSSTLLRKPSVPSSIIRTPHHASISLVALRAKHWDEKDDAASQDERHTDFTYHDYVATPERHAPVFVEPDINVDAADLWQQPKEHRQQLMLEARHDSHVPAAGAEWQLQQPPTPHPPIQKAPPTPSEITQARWLLIGAAALYGTNFSLVKLLGQTDMPVGLSSAVRFGMAALATSPWLFGPSREPPQKQGDMMGPAWAATLAGMEVGLWNSIGYVAQAVGLETTLASKSAFLCSLAVVTVPLLDFIAGKRLLPREMAGALMALAGVAVLELNGLNANDLALSSGDIASLVQPLAFGMGFWRMERAMHRFPTEANRSTAGQLLAVFLGSLLYCAVTDPASLDWQQVWDWLHDPMIVLGLFWTGVVTTAFTVWMETMALKTLSAAETTLIFSSEPLWGAAFAAVVMGETLGIDTAIGAVLIVFGCVFSNLGVNGFKELVTGKTNKERVGADGQAPAPQDLPQVMQALDPQTPSGGWLRLGTIMASISGAAAGMWNNVDMSLRVFAMQVSEFVEQVMELPDV